MTDEAKSLYSNDYFNLGENISPYDGKGIFDPSSGSGGIDENGNPYILFWIYPGQTVFNAKFVQFDYSDLTGWTIGAIRING
jgi:hypothetical protein